MFTYLYFILAAVLLLVVLRLTCGPCVMGHPVNPVQDAPAHPRLPVVVLGWALSLFLTITYVLCVGFDLIFPDYAMNGVWIGLMPGMTWLSVPSFLLGLVWAFLYGWYGAVLFGGLFNAIAARTYPN